MSPSNEDEKPSSIAFKERRFKLSRYGDHAIVAIGLLLTLNCLKGPVIVVGESQ